MGGGRQLIDGVISSKGGSRDWEKEPLTELDEAPKRLPSRSCVASPRQHVKSGTWITRRIHSI